MIKHNLSKRSIELISIFDTGLLSLRIKDDVLITDRCTYASYHIKVFIANS